MRTVELCEIMLLCKTRESKEERGREGGREREREREVFLQGKIKGAEGGGGESQSPPELKHMGTNIIHYTTGNSEATLPHGSRRSIEHDRVTQRMSL